MSKSLTGESISLSPVPGQETNVSAGQLLRRRVHPKEATSKIKCIALQSQRGKAISYIYFTSLELSPAATTE